MELFTNVGLRVQKIVSVEILMMSENKTMKGSFRSETRTGINTSCPFVLNNQALVLIFQQEETKVKT